MLIKELVLHKKLVRQPKQNNEGPAAKEDTSLGVDHGPKVLKEFY